MIVNSIRSLGRIFSAAALAVLLCPFSVAQSQPPDASPKPALPVPEQSTATQPSPATPKTPDFSKEAIVFDKLLVRQREEADGTGSREITVRARILADAGVKAMAVLSYPYSSLNQKVDYAYVRVIKPDGTVVVTPSYNIQDLPADVTRDAPMYSDLHQKYVAVKGLGVGDTLEYQVTIDTLKPEDPGQFWLDYSFPTAFIVLDEQFDLDVPADKTVSVTSADVQPSITTAGDRRLYHWSNSNLSRPDPDAPGKPKAEQKPSIQVTTFVTWAQVGAWYNSLQKDALTVTPAIQARADALTKGLVSDEDKLHAIFNDVALHIHYVGLEFGIGRYQPHSGDDVLSNEYGDCKDKHTLLATLLKAAGIEAWPVLISSSRELDLLTPSPAQFDHVITLVPLHGKFVWMDSTEEVAPIGVLAAALRDKQVLAVPVSKPAYLEHTPVNLPSPRTIRVEIHGSLSDQGHFTGNITETSDGDIAPIMRAAFRRVPQAEWKELVERIARAQNYGGEVDNPQVSEVEKIDDPFHFSFDYSREKYYQWDDSQAAHWVGAPMPPMGGELPPGIKENKPADDPELGATGETIYKSSMQLPDGWEMDPPNGVNIVKDWAEYHSTYAFSNGIFTVERRLSIKQNKVPLAKWDEYIAYRRQLGADMETQVLIRPEKLHRHK